MTTSVCFWCDEPLAPYERHHLMRAYHHECAVRSVVGSVAHLRRECGCFVEGSSDSDPEGMSKRQAAQAAYREFHRTIDMVKS